jgi:hypothetical protein
MKVTSWQYCTERISQEEQLTENFKQNFHIPAEHSSLTYTYNHAAMLIKNQCTILREKWI